jgi:hypothetical protein
MPPEIETILVELARDPGGRKMSARITRLIELWTAAFPVAEPENSAWWDGQHRIADAAPRVARYNWTGAMRLAGLIHNPAWQAKVRLCCQMERQHLAEELAETDPERALQIARRLNRQFRSEALLHIAVVTFPKDQERALDLYREACPNAPLTCYFLLAIAPYDWRRALELAEPWSIGEEDHFLSRIVPLAVGEDFARAEELTARISGPVYRFTVMQVLLGRLPPLDVPEMLALMERPLYREHRIQIFAHCRSAIRAFCGLPAEETGEFVRPDGEDPFWDFFRSVLRRTEADLPWALEQVRGVEDLEKRRFLFAYMDAEFCHAR